MKFRNIAKHKSNVCNKNKKIKDLILQHKYEIFNRIIPSDNLCCYATLSCNLDKTYNLWCDKHVICTSCFKDKSKNNFRSIYLFKELILFCLELLFYKNGLLKMYLKPPFSNLFLGV